MENENKDVLPPVQILDLARRCGIKATEAALVEFAALVRGAEPLAPEEMRPVPVTDTLQSGAESALDLTAERALFEAWMRSEGLENYLERYSVYDPKDERSYKSRHTTDKWEGWHARAALACRAAAPHAAEKAPSGPNLYRKTALVHAEQFLPAEGKIPAGVISDGHGDPRTDARFSFVLQTLEGVHQLRDGDYICTGPKGEKWNVERSIFESTYEPALARRATAPHAAQPVEAAGSAVQADSILVRALERIAMNVSGDHPAQNIAGDALRDYRATPPAEPVGGDAPTVSGKTAAGWYVAYCEVSAKLKQADGCIERYAAELAEAKKAAVPAVGSALVAKAEPKIYSWGGSEITLASLLKSLHNYSRIMPGAEGRAKWAMREAAKYIEAITAPTGALVAVKDEQHPDDLAVDRFAAAMKAKMSKSRDKGRYGWDDPVRCSVEYLQMLLMQHLAKGDPVDIGNFAMMLFSRGATTSSESAAAPADLRQQQFEAEQAAGRAHYETWVVANERAPWDSLTADQKAGWVSEARIAASATHQPTTKAGPRDHDDPELVAVAKRIARQNREWGGAQIEAAARAELGEQPTTQAEGK